MELKSSNVNSSNALLVSDTITLPSQNLNKLPILAITAANTNSINIGQVNMTAAAVTVPNLITLGGITFSPTGNFYGGIVNSQSFTANGTWNNPITNNSLGLTGSEQVFMMLWGGGGGGGGSSGNISCGGGGGCSIITLPLNVFTNTCSIIIGLGGGSTTAIQQSGNGTNSVVLVNATANVYGFGGSGAFFNGTFEYPGTGGGTTSQGFASSTSGITRGGGPEYVRANSTSYTVPYIDGTYGGGSIDLPAGIAAGSSIFGGGGGGCFANAAAAWKGGDSIYGGGGGSCSSAVAGNSIFGGHGANNSIAASAPGGGGHPAWDGARGEVRIWVIR